MARVIKYVEALNEAQDLCMAKDPNVFLFGLGVSDPAAIFGSTKNLYQKYGPKRVVDMPVSENAMTGVALGAALAGMRPVMTHIRLEFALLAIDQIVNQAAKWHYMFGGQASVPMVIRLIVGRGWGQGAQHSQSLHSWFAHIPGLKVIMPSTPYDAKGLLVSAIEDNNPVLCIEHRWLYNLTGDVPEGIYKVSLTEPHVIQEGTDVTIVASSYSTIEALEAASDLEKEGISCEVIDLRLLNPLNDTKIIESVKKTGNLIVVDMGWRSGGFAAEIVARVVEKAHTALKNPPMRITLPDLPTPTSRALSNYYYPLPQDIANAARCLMGKSPRLSHINPEAFLDIGHLNFTGPF
jgi:acetoin:2,6-dichlorophenolindophenol oxidoreductase subunit beta